MLAAAADLLGADYRTDRVGHIPSDGIMSAGSAGGIPHARGRWEGFLMAPTPLVEFARDVDTDSKVRTACNGANSRDTRHPPPVRLERRKRFFISL